MFGGTTRDVASRLGQAQHLCELALLRRVCDGMDREYAERLDVEPVARGVNRHWSQQVTAIGTVLDLTGTGRAR